MQPTLWQTWRWTAHKTTGFGKKVWNAASDTIQAASQPQNHNVPQGILPKTLEQHSEGDKEIFWPEAGLYLSENG